MKRFIEEYDDGDDVTTFEPLDFDLDRIYGWLVSTGGTTGMIKLAALKHRTFFKKMRELKTMFRFFPRGDEEENQNREHMPVLHLPPVQWITSFFGALSSPAMRLTKVMTSAPTTTEHVIDIINKYRPVMAMMGPSMAAGIIKSEKECDLTCFATLTLLGAKVHKDIYLQLKKRLRPEVPLHDAYGQTENLGPILTPNPTGPVGNCGNCPFDWQKNIKLVDPETGTEIKKPYVKGEMWTKLTGFSEYYNNPEETANALTEDGWYKTGDILYRDEEGNYYFVERIKMLIKYRNYHVVPPEVEAVILEHPGVHYVSVTSIPHEEDGEHPVACVVKKDGSNVTAQEIKDLVASKLSDSQQLRGGVVFIDEIPLTSVGKIAYNKLKQIALTAQRE
ncbi:unnamed protein product [Arctia plantaginis]|uniref:Luciferin 4-monooxygenase n=1 Tax=Arctia plantaginis TaxID=874455 RepID=A0A8S0YLX5_ARCPL|nr:unnamed protein product [Arctia plantaginis]